MYKAGDNTFLKDNMNKNITTTIIMLLMIVGFCSILEANRKPNDISVRLSLGVAPGIDEVEGSSVEDDSGSRLEILTVKRFWSGNNPKGSNRPQIGGSIGGGFFLGRHSMSEPGLEVDMTAFGTIVQGGLVVDMGRGITFELTPYLGTGTAHNEAEGFDDGTGPYYLYGIKGSAFILFNENIEIGVDVGYEGFTHDQEHDFGSETKEITYEGSGARVALIIGMTF